MVFREKSYISTYPQEELYKSNGAIKYETFYGLQWEEEFCSNCGMKSCSSGAEPGHAFAGPTSEGLRVVSSHLYCFPGRKGESGHQSGSHQASQSEKCPTCAHWKPAGRRGCCTGMQAAP